MSEPGIHPIPIVLERRAATTPPSRARARHAAEKRQPRIERSPALSRPRKPVAFWRRVLTIAISEVQGRVTRFVRRHRPRIHRHAPSATVARP